MSGKDFLLGLQALLSLTLPVVLNGAETWPSQVKEINYVSSADGSRQPALVFAPDIPAKETRPLLVALHTWSSDYRQTGGELLYAKWCVQNGWLFIHPNFRGPNDKPQALGSELVVADISSAVDYMKANYPVDADRIYLIGGSGGAHASLLMAGRRPDLWAGVSAWCGISDIAKWHKQTKAAKLNYYKMIESACGGDPETDPESAKECAKRSPLTYLKAAKGLNLDINAGVHDGRRGSVPFSHSLYAFNEVAEPRDALSAEEIEAYYERSFVPSQDLAALADPAYGTQVPLFRRVSGNSRITIFEGGHDLVALAALNWLALQRKGVPAIWKIDGIKPIKSEAAAAGKIGS